MERTPLAEKMRPQTLDEVVGQTHLLGDSEILRQIVKKKEPVSLILWGPPGSGKTTLARIIAKEVGGEFVELSAVTSGKKDVENVKIQNIELPQDMKRAMARQAEAERERRAVVIDAEGEKQAAQAVADAAKIIANVKNGMNIRTLQTLERISESQSQKTLVILPSEMTGTTIAEAISMSEANK